MNQSKTLKAQILLITLLVMMIVSIIVIGVITVANRDVSQSVANQQYIQIQNSGESTMLEYINRYGVRDDLVTAITADVPTCIVVPSNKVDCALGQTSDGVENRLIIEDSSTIVGFELSKDESLELDLVSDPFTGKGFRGRILFDYTGTTALEFALVYRVAGQIQVVRDVLDNTGNMILEPGQGDPLDVSNPNHTFNIQQIAGGGYSFIINNIDGFLTTYEPVSLTITARMKTESNTSLSISADSGGVANPGVFPNQMRKFIVESYFGGEDSNIATRVSSMIPLLPQGASFLQHGIMSNTSISK